jgi:hypothetical protein
MKKFDDYQLKLFEEFKEFRIPYVGPVYPPYHKGLYLEESFFDGFVNQGQTIKQYFIPVFWTSCYLQNKTKGLQEKLSELDPEKEYFCVSQHDDAIKEKLPTKTTHFSAGGNFGDIPIPLICSPISYPTRDKKVFCSFVGSITHPIRQKLDDALRGRAGFEFYSKNWTPSISSTGEELFLRKTSESIFSLCPRGYGASSFRFYEALQLGAVPIFVTDKAWFPFDDVVDWDSFSIRIHESEIQGIPDILVEMVPFASKMVEAGKEAYNQYFSIHAFPKQIIRILDARSS